VPHSPRMPSVSQDHGTPSAILPSRGVTHSATKAVSFSTQGLVTQPDHLLEEARGGGNRGRGGISSMRQSQSEIDPSHQRVNANAGASAKPVDKRSLDYVLRSGLAGGVAGCAVSVSLSLFFCHRG
jgi:hypothetical protein